MLLSPMLGNGATAEIDAALHARLDDAVVPVFVVLTATPPGFGGPSVDEELTSLVHAELGDDGVYYVKTSQGSGHLAVYGDVDPTQTNDDTLWSLARYEALDQVRLAVEDTDPELDIPSVVEAAVILDLAASATIPDRESPVLSEDQVAVYTAQPWVSVGYVFDDDRPEPVGVGLGALVGVSVGLVVAVTAYRLLRAAAAALRQRTVEAESGRAQLQDAREAARTAIDDLEQRLERRTPGRGGAERRERASRCADVARDLLDSDVLVDLVGAEVLAVVGARELAGDTAYRCCYVDPRHGQARHDADLAGGLTVPACRPCQRDLDQGRPPAALRDGGRPYYEGESVWARTGYGALTDTLWDDVRRERAR